MTVELHLGDCLDVLAGLLKSRMIKMPNNHPARAYRKAV